MNPFIPSDVTLASLHDRLTRLEKAQRDMDLERLTEEEAAGIVRCSVRELRAAVKNKELRVLQIGERTWHKRAFLKEWQNKLTMEAA